jgi:hypothetical protein
MNTKAKIAIGVAAALGLFLLSRRANAGTLPGAADQPNYSPLVGPSFTSSGMAAPDVLGMSNTNTGMLPASVTPASASTGSVLPDLSKLISSIFTASPAPAPVSPISIAPAPPPLPAIVAPSSPAPQPVPASTSVTAYVAPSYSAAAPATFTNSKGVTFGALNPTQGVEVKNDIGYLSGLAFTDMPGG